MVELFSNLRNILSRETTQSVFVDTSILFSAPYPLDPFNEELLLHLSAFLSFKLPLSQM